MLVRYILSTVHLRLSPFSQLSLCNKRGWMFSAYSFRIWWLREYLYFILFHHQTGNINHHTLFMVWLWNYPVDCMSCSAIFKENIEVPLVGNPPVMCRYVMYRDNRAMNDRWFPWQRDSNVESVSIHYVTMCGEEIPREPSSHCWTTYGTSRPSGSPFTNMV